jgi:hypothetical protein
MADISDKEKLALTSLLASMGEPQTVNREKTADRLVVEKKVSTPKKKITIQDVISGKVSPGDANDSAMFQRNGGMIDRSAIRGKTRGKIC